MGHHCTKPVYCKPHTRFSIDYLIQRVPFHTIPTFQSLFQTENAASYRDTLDCFASTNSSLPDGILLSHPAHPDYRPRKLFESGGKSLLRYVAADQYGKLLSVPKFIKLPPCLSRV